MILIIKNTAHKHVALDHYKAVLIEQQCWLLPKLQRNDMLKQYENHCGNFKLPLALFCFLELHSGNYLKG